MPKKSEFSFTETDGNTMQLWQKGEILFLHHQGFTVRDISGTTGRSMDWITGIIGALVGCDVEPLLIEKYQEHLDEKDNKKNERKESITEKTHKRRVRYSPKREINKRDNSPILWGKRGLGTHTPRARKDSVEPTTRRTVHKDNNSSGESVANKLRKNKDYVGE